MFSPLISTRVAYFHVKIKKLSLNSQKSHHILMSYHSPHTSWFWELRGLIGEIKNANPRNNIISSIQNNATILSKGDHCNYDYAHNIVYYPKNPCMPTVMPEVKWTYNKKFWLFVELPVHSFKENLSKWTRGSSFSTCSVNKLDDNPIYTTV